MTKIEEVALALCRDGCATMPSTSCREKCRAFDDPPTKPGGEYFSSRRQMYLREARAAIEAMRTPTPLMIKAAEKLRTFDGPYHSDASAEEQWPAMIAAALSE